MCGYVGELSLQPKVNRARLYRMNNILIHRGPDESGIVVSPDRRWGLAHRRLSVIDIEGGKQPMADAERGLTLVYNGEIYGHDQLRQKLGERGYRFHSSSDTEVLLALYAVHGLDLFTHLRGEYSFAIVDERRRQAILVRDRMGLKPLFYARVGDSLLFASEIKALFQAPEVPRAIDPAGLTGAIAVADTPGHTVFRGIRQVRHAHYLRVNLDTLETSEHRYWDALAERSKNVPDDPREQIEAVRAEIDRAIALRLRADVPIGAYLSGGLDSSLITAVMAKRMDHVEAFALAFEDSARHNEFHYAQAVAKRYPNIHLHRISVTHDDTIRRLPETVYHLERPFGNLHSVAKIMQAQYARQHVECVLTGDGGDECFCGYSTHWLQDTLQKADYSLSAVEDELRRMRREAKGIGGNRYYLTCGLARQIGAQSQFLHDRLGFRPADLATAIDSERRVRWLMNPEFEAAIERSPVERLVDQLAETMPASNGVPHATLLQYVQLNTSVPEYIATIADRSEWAGSVEARPPLFDHKVAELAMALPLSIKLQGDREKHVLREAYKDLLPTEVLERRKQAFLAPPAPFRGPAGRALLGHYLSPAAVRQAGIWSPTKIALLRAARRLMPGHRHVNIALTVALTAQILHEQFVKLDRSWR